MKKILLAAAALGILAGTPAVAQEFRLRAGPDGVTVRGGDDDRFDRRRYEERRVYRDRRVMREDRDDCRTVTTRVRRGDGSVVVRRERQCY